MNKEPQSLRDVVDGMRPKTTTSVLKERVVFVPKGPEMTPLMEALIRDALWDLVKQSAKAYNIVHPELIQGYIEETLRFIETRYLGILKGVLDDYERAHQLQEEGRILEVPNADI